MTTKKLGKYDEVVQIMGDYQTLDHWILMPMAIPGLRDKHEEFAKVVQDARIQLVHTKWDEANDAARELSDVGGIEFVNIYRVKRTLHLNCTFLDGKQTKQKP